MHLSRQNIAHADFRRLARVKQIVAPAPQTLGPEMLEFFQQSVARQQTKLGKICQIWAALMPDTLSAHCTLNSLYRGTLTVLVDSASHLYELRQLLLAGMEQQLLIAAKSTGLRKISLRPGAAEE